MFHECLLLIKDKKTFNPVIASLPTTSLYWYLYLILRLFCLYEQMEPLLGRVSEKYPFPIYMNSLVSSINITSSMMSSLKYSDKIYVPDKYHVLSNIQMKKVNRFIKRMLDEFWRVKIVDGDKEDFHYYNEVSFVNLDLYKMDYLIELRDCLLTLKEIYIPLPNCLYHWFLELLDKTILMRENFGDIEDIDILLISEPSEETFYQKKIK